MKAENRYKMTDDRRQTKVHAGSSRFLFVVVFCLTSVFWPLASLHAATWSPEAEIAAYLKANFPWAETDISDVRMSAEAPAKRPTAIIVEKAPPGRSVFRFDFQGKAGLTVTASIKTFDQVLMSRGAFGKSYVLKQDDVYATLMESSRIPKGAFREQNQAIGKPLVRAIVQNKPITDAMISSTPLVKRGRRVMLYVESPGFSIRTMGETKNDAAVGQYVKATNLGSNKIVTGQLLDENTVRVEY
jgi:flagella basal body P-ring formation protein FlgA